GRGVIVGVIAPPPTDTAMLRELIGPENAAQQAKPSDSVRGLIELIDRLTLEDSGRPLFIDGTALPW
ncbi:MAG TPA: hypothetical protein VFV10_01975, partial [Gammaproteobacteria bacterium]|nr:hypothetical protein [Gammaproteobacteria bacterium]